VRRPSRAASSSGVRDVVVMPSILRTLRPSGWFALHEPALPPSGPAPFALRDQG
jgi:hypothetical protein